MMMSGGFAAFSFGIFFEGMNINLPGNVLIAGSRALYNSCPVDQCILGWLEITKQTRGAKVSPVFLSKPEWYCLMVMVRLKMINHPTPSLGWRRQVPRSMRLKEPMKVYPQPGREQTMKVPIVSAVVNMVNSCMDILALLLCVFSLLLFLSPDMSQDPTWLVLIFLWESQLFGTQLEVYRVYCNLLHSEGVAFNAEIGRGE